MKIVFGKYVRMIVVLFVFIHNMIGDGFAQDLHFSQFFNSPLSTNPANTGFIPNSDYRVGVNYRDQWSTIPVPYKTTSIWADAQFMREKIPGGWFGIGGLVLQDAAGKGALKSTKAYLSVAYHQMLGESGLLSSGFNIGYAGKQIDESKLTFDEQWNGKFFDIGKTSGEILQNNSVAYLDLQAGLNYAWFPTDNIYFHTGFSLHHFNRPAESFFLNSHGNDNRLRPRSIFFADAMIKLNEQLIISPAFFYTSQAKASEFVGGMQLNLNVAQDGDQQFIAGFYSRTGDAFIPMLGYQWRGFRFTFTYDITNSPLKNFNIGRGANELSMLFEGITNPELHSSAAFTCPRFGN
jgi:type IX secretion system PorP/SprF family membrane protein